MAYLDNEIITDAKCIHIASSKLMEIPFTKGYQMLFTASMNLLEDMMHFTVYTCAKMFSSVDISFTLSVCCVMY